MGKPKRYPVELCERLVRLVLEQHGPLLERHLQPLEESVDERLSVEHSRLEPLVSFD